MNKLGNWAMDGCHQTSCVPRSSRSLLTVLYMQHYIAQINK